MISKSSFLADLAANNKRRTWNIAIFAVLLLIFYPLFLALVLRSVLYSGYEGKEIIIQMNEAFREYMCFPVWSVVVATIFAAIASIHGFSYLYSKKKIDMYLSLPVSKSRRFATIYINGLLMYYIPLVVCLVICLIIGKSFGVNDSSALKIAVMSFGVNCIYYFSVYNVVLIALMLTGNFVVTVLGAGTLLFYENGIRLLLLGYFEKFFNTYSHYSSDKFLKTWISPIGIITTIEGKVINNVNTASYTLSQIKMSVLQLFILSLIFLVIAYLLYMKRPMESCSKAMAFTKTKSIIKRLIMVPAALFVGICFCIGSDAGNDEPVMILGLIIGLVLCHCVIEMIYEFDIRAVFKDKRSLIYCGVVAGAIFAVFSLDIFGYDKYVPKNDKLDNAAIFVSFNNAYAGSSFDDKWNYIDENDRVFKEMKVKQTEVITDIAQKNMEEKNNSDESKNLNETDSTRVQVCYTFKNGKKVYRQFNINYGQNADLLNKLFANSDYKETMSNINSPIIDKCINNMTLSYSNGVSQQNADVNVNDFVNTYKKDYTAMTFDDVYEKIPVGYIELTYDLSKYESRVFDYPVYKSYTNTIAKLKDAGINIEGYIKPEEIESMTINNYDYDDETDTPTNSEIAKKYSGDGIEKTYDDEKSIDMIGNALVPSDITQYAYVCGTLVYDSCDASVTLKNNGKYKWSQAPVSCLLLKKKTPDFVKTDLHLNDSDNSQPDNLSKNTVSRSEFVQEITGTER
ncbi:MAG: DUF6449 domain-containing protein [Clostridia bacterium]|jgi:hypothetical protein|nr:DUF6449 domain-containing protein [Clostridia bacterium]MCI1999197.1 DUF6449 domain-containing protein [Clostridia bacterium]MCI2014850.1 DUF6449 domain-containing protein [Clostridia bacterium]